MNRKICQTLLWWLTFSLLALSLGCNRDPNARKLKFLAAGDHEFEQQKYGEAVIEYGRALQIDPHFAEAHYKLAQCYLKQHLWAVAYQELLRTVNLKPDDWAAQLDLGKLLLEGGKSQDAKERAILILKNNPDSTDAQILLSGADALLGNSKEALEEAQDAVGMAPNRSDVYLHLGLLQAKYGAYQESEKNLIKAQQLDPKSDRPLMTLGTFYAQQGRWPDAEKEFQTAIQVAPQDPLPRAALAGLYRSEGKNELAVKVLADAKQQLSSNPNAYSLLGDYYVSVGDTSHALAEFASLVQEHPKDLNARKSYVQLLILAGRIPEASKLTDEILKNSSEDAEALILKGEILLRQKNNAEALSTLQQAVKDAPDNAGGHYQLGLALQATGSDSQALDEWKKAVQLRPNLADAWIALGSAATRRGDWQGLEADGTQLQKIAPRATEGYLFHATARFNQGDAAGAEADLNHVIAIAPQSSLGYAKLGQLREAQKRWKDAENLYNEALKLDTNSIDATRGLTEVDLEQGKSAKALQFIQSQIDRNPKSAALYLLQGEVLLRNKNFADAEKVLLQCTELDQQNLAAFVLLAQVQSSLGKPSDAISSYQRAVAISPNNSQLYTALGSAYEAQENWQQAEATYQKALAFQSDNALAANNLAYLMLEHGGDINVALTLARTARRGLPNLPNSADTLGWAYFANGAYTLAQSLLDQAVKQVPTNATYHYHLGMTYERLKETERARAELQKSLKLDPQAPFASKASRALDELSGG
jgi:tetratricopeptide (TPR) repeat protein